MRKTTTTMSIMNGSLLRRRFCLLIAMSFAAAVLTFVPRSHGLDIFMSLVASNKSGLNIPGESKDSGYSGTDGYFVLRDVSFGFKNTATKGSTGFTAGKVEFLELNFEKVLDSASTSFFKAITSGGHYESARIAIRKTGATGKEAFVEFEFGKVFFLKQDWNAEKDAGSVIESIQMVFESCKIIYRPIQDGVLGKPRTQFWNQVSNSATVQGTR
jgi:type VI protein secretion system component Hcp